MKYSQMKRFLMEHKDSMKPPYISTLDGILTAGGELIGYQELEMDSPYRMCMRIPVTRKTM